MRFSLLLVAGVSGALALSVVWENARLNSSPTNYGTIDVESGAEVPETKNETARRRPGLRAMTGAGIAAAALLGGAVVSDNRDVLERFKLPTCIPAGAPIDDEMMRKHPNLARLDTCSKALPAKGSAASSMIAPENLETGIFSSGPKPAPLDENVHDISMREELFRFDWYGRTFVDTENAMTGERTILSIAPNFGRVELDTEDGRHLGYAQYWWWNYQISVGDLEARLSRRTTFDIKFTGKDSKYSSIAVVKGWWGRVEFIQGGRKIAVLTRPLFNWTWDLQVENDCDLPDALFILAVGDVFHEEILEARERRAEERRKRNREKSQDH